MAKKNKKAAVDLSNVYKVKAEKGIVKHTIKCRGQYFTGVAKTNFEAGDVFDEEKGKRIAKLRAILMMKHAMLAEATEMLEKIQELKTLEPELNKFIDQLTKRIDQVETKLNDTLGITKSAEETKE